MKRLFLILIISVLYFNTYAQISNDLIIEHLEKMSENSEEEYSDYSELLESYWSITENPININSNDIDQLAELKFISVFQLENIKNYRKKYGDFQFLEELHEVNGLDSISIELIKPIIRFNEDRNHEKIEFKNVLKYGKHKY